MRGGQALVIVVIALGVMLTVGLSIASRSLTEVNVSTTQDESAEALSAAEAGLEGALGNVYTGEGETTGSLSSGASFTVDRTNIGGANVFVVPAGIAAGETVTLWLTGPYSTYPTGTDDLMVCLGEGGADTAVELTGYYQTAAGTFVVKKGYDTNPGRAASTGFAVMDGANGCFAVTTPKGSNFSYSATIDNFMSGGLFPNVNPTPVLVRARVLYNGSGEQPVGFVSVGSWSLPNQGDNVISTGQAGVATQKIAVTKLNPDTPPIFDDAVYSGSSLSQ